MLPDNTRQLIDRVVEIALASRKEILRAELQRTAEWAVQAGVSGSGLAAFKRAKVYCDLIERLANQTWTETKRVLEEVQFKPCQQLAQDLKDYIRDTLAVPYEECRSGTYTDPQVTNAQPKPIFVDHYDSIERKLFAEIDLFCAKLEAQHAEKEANRVVQSVTYNLHGDNLRINIHSQDYSVNVSNAKLVFKEIRKSIETGVGDEKLKAALLQKASELEEVVGKASFLQKYSDFVALAANHMTLLGPFIPALTQLLQK